MTAALVLPLKAFASAKQRLAGLFTAAERAALARAMAEDALERLVTLNLPLLVVCADPSAAALSASYGGQVVAETGPGQSAAVQAGLQACLQAGHPVAATVALDIPGLDPREVRALVEAHAAPGVAAVTDRHGIGTNALRLQPPDAIAVHFGPDSLARHQAAAVLSGWSFEVLSLPSLAIDLDEAEDVAAFLRAPVRGRTLTLLQELDGAERLRRRASLAG